MSAPLVSVVIPTYNRMARLHRVLDALDAQTLDRERFEVVVVSDGSTDGTDHYLEGAAAQRKLRLVTATQANAGPAAARNRGIQLACGERVLFVDDDVVAAPDLVEQHLRTSDGTGSDTVVVGPMLTPPDFRMSAWVQWEQEMLYRQYEAMDHGDYIATFRQFYTGNASVPRARLVEAGGFDTSFRRAEDVELAYRLHRAGVGFTFNRHAIGYHYAERPFLSWLRTARDYGRNDVVFAREHGRDADLKEMAFEFGERNLVGRWVCRLGAAWPRVAAVASVPLRHLAVGAHRVGLSAASRAALSTVYNMAYYGAIADELGGADRFRRVVVEGRGWAKDAA